MAVTTRLLLLVTALLGGCMHMSENECRSADWYQVGYRDADPYGQRPQLYLYENECKAWVQVSEADYMRGWVDGYREWNARVHAGECANC